MKSLLSDSSGFGKIYKMSDYENESEDFINGYDFKNIMIEIDSDVYVKIKDIEKSELIDFNEKFSIEVVGESAVNKKLLGICLFNMSFYKNDGKYFYFKGVFDEGFYGDISVFGE